MTRPTDDELKAAHQAARYESDLAEQALQEMRAQKARAEAVEAKLKEAAIFIEAIADGRFRTPSENVRRARAALRDMGVE